MFGTAPAPAPGAAAFGALAADPASASPAAAPPATAGFGFGSAAPQPVAGSAAAAPTGAGAGTTPAAAPAFGAAAAPATAAPAATPAAAAAPPPLPAAPSYAKLFDRACRDGVVGAAFLQEIKKRFSAPMEVKAVLTAAAVATAGAAALGVAQQISAQTPASFASRTGFVAPSGLGANAVPPATSTLARSADAQLEHHLRRGQIENTHDFLQLLLLCDSGYNNSEAPPADNPASSQWMESCEEAVKGLHAAVSSIAASAASNLISFIKARFVKHAQAFDGEAASASSLFGDSRRKRSQKDPLLLAAQCLYVLSRHFQLTASVVKEALDLMDELYSLLKMSLGSRVVPLASFSESADTCSLNSLTWLCVFSVVNMAAVWKKLRCASGELRLNELIQSSVASSIEVTVAKLRKQLREAVQPSSSGLGSGGGHYGGGLDALGGGGGARQDATSAMLPPVYTWQVLVDSYLSILTLAEGCLLRAKGSEQGYDRALDAFLGERMAAAGGSGSASSSAAAAASPASVAVHRGKVTKRMVELAPVPRTLSIPVELLYIAPYEMMSYLFDEMLPLLRHLSELEVSTHRRYVEQLEDLPRVAAVSGGSGGYGFQQRTAQPYLQQSGVGGLAHTGAVMVEGDGSSDDGWLRRITRVGVAGELVGEPFSSEMAHLLEALAVCLQHLPPEVLNPDLDADCAATFFIFKNFVKHMRQVFATQRAGGIGNGGAGSGPGSSSSVGLIAAASSAVWENYTLKLMTKFLEVLAMIGRNPQYMQRVVVLLTDAQTECGELQWQSLVSQALECAGFSSSALGSNGASPSSMAMAAAALQSGSRAEGDDGYAATPSVIGANGVPRTLHRQFTRAYARKCQRQYISSFFLMLRQLFAHPALRPVVSSFMNLELALTFLFAPQQNQVMLGSTLSLISALIANAADAQLVWSFLEQRRLLQPPSARAPLSGANGAVGGKVSMYDRFTSAAMAGGTGGPAGGASQELEAHEETLSLIGHCQYESTQGTYDITIGFLNLVTALFQHDQPSMAALIPYTTATSFIAQDILRGVLKRVFVTEHERYTVFALAAAALRQALLTRFHSDNGRAAVLPFATVMALNKAPTDVVGEVLKIILDASDAPYELLSHHRAAVRQAMRLLITAIEAAQEQKLELLLFDSRTTLNRDLAVRVLGMCSLQDTLLTKTTLQLLLLFPFDTANQAAQYWSGLNAKYAPVLEAFTRLLHPLNTVPVVVQAPPDLAQLDFEPAELVPGWATALLTETKSLLLDLLMRHADVTEPSLTAWMCGFYDEEYAPRAAAAHGEQQQRQHAYGGEPKWWRATLLTSVVEGACSFEVERTHPALAVKCVKLLYLLRANRLYGTRVVRPFLESVCQTLFLRLQQFQANQCTPVALNKYAYVLKLLALEACYTYRAAPEDLQLTQSTSIPSIAVEVLLSLLHPYGATAGLEAADAGVSTTFIDDAAALTSGAALGGSDNAIGHFAEASDDADGGIGGSDENASAEKPWGSRGKAEGKGSTAATATTIVSRDAAADITSWLPQALQVLPAFPEKLPLVGGGRSHLIPCASDGVVQYNMASLYEALQLEQLRAGKPALTMAELRAKLRPFIAANDCFFSYAAGVSFVEGWCQLVSISCSVVKGLSMSRLRAFALCILRGLDATTTMTAVAQEQVASRLCHCLSTVMAHLRQTAQLSLDSALSAGFSGQNSAERQLTGGSFHRGGDYDTLDRESSRLSALDASRRRSSGAVVLGQSNRVGSGRRRPREDGAARSGGRPTLLSGSISSRRNAFTTQAGDTSNFFSATKRSQLAQSLLQQRQAERDTRSLVVDGASAWSDAVVQEVAANAELRQPLVRALVAWGSRIVAIRTDLYMSLLCLAETPGVNLDDVVLWRSQKALLDIICTDICNGCATAAAGGVAVSGGGADGGLGDGVVQGGGTAAAATNVVGVSGSPSLQLQHAVSLLVALLQASAAIRDDFCSPETSKGDGIGTRALRCATALLQSVDSAVCGFFAGSGSSFGTLLWHTRSTFDVLSVISLGHASQVLNADLLQSCFAMRAWQYSTQVVLGYSQAGSAFDQLPTGPLVEQNKELLRRLLLGVVRWVNLLLATLTDAAPLLYEAQKFVRDNRSLIDYVFMLPAAASGTQQGPPRLSASHVTLCAELSDCLRAMSSSVLAIDCRDLVDSMALPELLRMLSSDEVWHRGSIDWSDLADFNSGAVAGSGLGRRVGGRSGVGSAGASLYGGNAGIAAAASHGLDGGRRDEGGADGGALLSIGATSGSAAAAMHALSAAERGRDLIALTVRNLSHLLLNAENGLRGTAHDRQQLDGDGSRRTPMLRHSAGKRHLILQIVRQVSQSVREAGGCAQQEQQQMREYRLECYLYALHALVCLLHSFVVPLPSSPQEQPYPTDYLRYLTELPLHELIDVLTLAHGAVYQLADFNTDYRGGVDAGRVGASRASAGAIEASHGHTAGQTLSNSMHGFHSATEGDATHAAPPVATPKSGPVGGVSESFSVPSTPALLPTTDVRRGGRDGASVQVPPLPPPPPRSPGMMAATAASSRDAEHLRGGSVVGTAPIAPATVAGGARYRDPSTTVVVQSHGGTRSAAPASTTPLPAFEEGERLPAQSTLWELLPKEAKDRDGNTLTRLYDSVSDGGVVKRSSRGADLALIEGPELLEWADVLNIENEVRQVKVAIANAVRATKGAIELVKQSTAQSR